MAGSSISLRRAVITVVSNDSRELEDSLELLKAYALPLDVAARRVDLPAMEQGLRSGQNQPLRLHVHAKQLAFSAARQAGSDRASVATASRPPFCRQVLQGESEEIAEHKCWRAAEHVGAAVLVSHTSLCLNALSGVPGPYVDTFITKLGLDGFVALLANYKDKSAYAETTLGFSHGPGSAAPEKDTPGTGHPFLPPTPCFLCVVQKAIVFR